MELSVQDGRITGGAKPILTDVDVAPGGPGFFDELRSWVAGGIIELLSEEVGDRERVAPVPVDPR